MADIKRFVAFSCPHCPLEDPEAVEFVLDEIRTYKPDVIVHLGDGHEASGASRFPDEERFTLMDEFQAHNEFLKKIRLAASDRGVLKSKLVFLPGNHDDNIIGQGRINPKLRPMCDYHYWEPELTEYWKEPTEYVNCKKKGIFRIGQVAFGHGWECGVNADEFHALMFAEPNGLYVGGHLHRPSGVTRCFRTKTLPLDRYFANAGCLSSMDRYYMRRSRKIMWGQALVKGSAELTKSYRSKRHWDAETVVFRMQEDL